MILLFVAAYAFRRRHLSESLSPHTVITSRVNFGYVFTHEHCRQHAAPERAYALALGACSPRFINE